MFPLAPGEAEGIAWLHAPPSSLPSPWGRHGGEGRALSKFKPRSGVPIDSVLELRTVATDGLD